MKGSPERLIASVSPVLLQAFLIISDPAAVRSFLVLFICDPIVGSSDPVSQICTISRVKMAMHKRKRIQDSDSIAKGYETKRKQTSSSSSRVDNSHRQTIDDYKTVNIIYKSFEGLIFQATHRMTGEVVAGKSNTSAVMSHRRFTSSSATFPDFMSSSARASIPRGIEAFVPPVHEGLSGAINSISSSCSSASLPDHRRPNGRRILPSSVHLRSDRRILLSCQPDLHNQPCEDGDAQAKVYPRL